MNQPLVSIIIPCYNAEKWVAQSIQSSLDQTWPNKEVIVIDDGSTDASLNVIKSFGDKIRWETGPNRGGNVARNRGLEMAGGEWIQYLDADDYLLPHKIAQQVQFLSTSQDTDIIYGPVIVEDWYEDGSSRKPLPIPEPHDPWILLARWYLPQTGASLWRRQAILDVGGWKPDQPCCQEHELYLRLLMAGKHFAYCASNGAVYRQWGSHTVCKRKPQELHRRTVEILEAASNHLACSGSLSSSRLDAINQMRFSIARQIYHYAPRDARRLHKEIVKASPQFVPDRQIAKPFYTLMYRIVGFVPAEKIRRVIRSAS
jgi:GT2 family glycosyltransferase